MIKIYQYRKVNVYYKCKNTKKVQYLVLVDKIKKSSKNA